MKMRIQTLLIGAVLTLVMFSAVQGWMAISRLALVNEDARQMGENWLPSVDAIHRLADSLNEMRIREMRHVTTPDANEKRAIESQLAETTAKIAADRVRYEALISSPEERTAYSHFATGYQQLIPVHQQIIDLSREGKTTDATALQRGRGREFHLAMHKHIDELISINRAGAQAQTAGAASTFSSARAILLGIVIAGAFLGLVAIALVIFAVTRPLARITSVMDDVSKGRLDVEIPYIQTQNEIGDQARTLMTFRDSLRDTEKMRSDQAAAKAADEQRQRAQMLDLANRFETSVGSIVDIVSAAATEMQATATQLTASAQEASAQSNSVASAAEEAGANVTAVAGSAEELGASVLEIGRQVEHSAQLARGAVKEADATGGIVADLSQSAARIGDIVDMISGIASQTNLLALNATIEAARAGEAGKGFAVVAQEVKGLAEQTAKATSEIGAQIVNIQETTQKAVDAIAGITGSIRSIDQATTSIASAVEQQSSATREIVNSVSQASGGTTEVSSAITSVAQAAAETGHGAKQVLDASSDLARQAERLSTEVKQFIASVRSA